MIRTFWMDPFGDRFNRHPRQASPDCSGERAGTARWTGILLQVEKVWYSFHSLHSLFGTGPAHSDLRGGPKREQRVRRTGEGVHLRQLAYTIRIASTRSAASPHPSQFNYVRSKTTGSRSACPMHRLSRLFGIYFCPVVSRYKSNRFSWLKNGSDFSPVCRS